MNSLLPTNGSSPAKRLSVATKKDRADRASGDNSTSDNQLVLIVDDDKKFAETLGETVADQGYDVLVANDGNTGLAYAIARQPDLILLDVRMPRRSGFLVLEYLRTKTDLDCPVIFMCDCHGSRHENYATLLGADLYVRKPVNGGELSEMVNGMLRKQEHVSEVV